MKSKALPHIILAVVLALAAGFLTIRWLGSVRRGGPQPAKVAVKKVEVVVAAKAIPKGARLDADMLRRKAYEADLAPSSAERDPAALVGRVTSRDISKDDPITPDKLLPRGVTVAGLPGAVEPGKRAVTVKGSKIMGSGGLITPGSRVDVVATFSVTTKNGDRKVGKVLMQDIPVLTTGTQMETRIGKDGKEELASTDLYTLMVSPEQAEALVLATDHGNLHFALRHTGDDGSSPTPGADFGAMIGGAGVGGLPGRGDEASAPAVKPASPEYAYQAVRVSAPLAAPSGSGGGGAGGGGGGGGGAQAPAPAVPAGDGAAPAATQAQKGAGITEEPQGSDRITIYKVTIDPSAGRAR